MKPLDTDQINLNIQRPQEKSQLGDIEICMKPQNRKTDEATLFMGNHYLLLAIV